MAELPTFENELREALFTEICGCIGGGDNAPLDLKVEVYQIVSKLKNSKPFKEMEKKLSKIAKESYDGRWRVEDILKNVTMCQLCDLKSHDEEYKAVMKKAY